MKWRGARILALVVIASAGGVTGCVSLRSVDEMPEPVVAAAGAYGEAPGMRIPGPGVKESEAWWRTLKDPVLTGLEEQAQANNLELAGFAARIAQANALLRQAGARLFPIVDVTGEIEGQWEDGDGDGSGGDNSSFGGNGGGGGDDVETSLGTMLDWEIDAWGRLRAAKSAERKELEATVSDWVGARLVLSTALAETYLELQEQVEQLRLQAEQVELNERLLELTRLRFGQGQSSIVDVLQQQQQLESTEARRPDLEARIRQLEYAMDVLLGVAPGQGPRPELDGPEPPPPLPGAGIPSDLLLRRPDLIASRQRVAGLDYRVTEAMADRLPRINVGGAVAAMGDPSYESLVTSAFGSVVAPVFDAGLRKAEVDLRRAEFDEAMANYSHDFLTAVSEVETALVLERKQGEKVRLLETQLATAQRLLRESRNRYSQGLTDYLPVLNAVSTVQDLERDVVTARRQWRSFRVGLHRALGGPLPDAPVPISVNLPPAE